MSTVAENLKTAKANYAKQLADLSLNPKPSYIIDGQNVAWKLHQDMLLAAIASIDRLLQAEEPYQLHSEGF